MKIGIVPSIKETYPNQFEFKIDVKLVKFLQTVFKKADINILCNTKFKKINFLCLSGGNDLTIFKNNKSNILRSKIDNFYYQKCKKKNIPILGICYGAQFIAFKEKARLKKKRHLGYHDIFFVENNKKKYVNSYHNYIITKLPKSIKSIAVAKDKSIECFHLKQKKILGIIWHPEREKMFKKGDIQLIKKYS